MSTQTEMTTPEWEPQDEIESLRRQLAASQAREAQLREVLHKLACLGNGARYGTSDGNRIAQEALALPSDTTTLSAVIAKASEMMRIRCENTATRNGQRRTAEAIRALPGVTLEDLK